MIERSGGWTIEKSKGRTYINDQGGTRVCTIANWCPEIDAADACLIAAAPDMLAALKVIADKHAASPVIWAEEVAIARAAIAKAEGKSK